MNSGSGLLCMLLYVRVSFHQGNREVIRTFAGEELIFSEKTESVGEGLSSCYIRRHPNYLCDGITRAFNMGAQSSFTDRAYLVTNQYKSHSTYLSETRCEIHPCNLHDGIPAAAGLRKPCPIPFVRFNNNYVGCLSPRHVPTEGMTPGCRNVF